MHQEELGDIHWSWLNVGATGILENISALIEWCPSGICWIMILWWQGQLIVSRQSWNVNGQRRWVCFWTDVRWTSRPWRRSGAAILQVSCKYIKFYRSTLSTEDRYHICTSQQLCHNLSIHYKLLHFSLKKKQIQIFSIMPISISMCLQCFDTVGRAAGRASSL